jgi:hypothetical protein
MYDTFGWPKRIIEPWEHKIRVDLVSKKDAIWKGQLVDKACTKSERGWQVSKDVMVNLGTEYKCRYSDRESAWTWLTPTPLVNGLPKLGSKLEVKG